MEKPYLLVVTGRPGSGKTTFARAFGEKIYMPVVSRDQLKEGYVRTFGAGHDELPPDVNGIVTGVFFEKLRTMVSGGVSVIAEAAFQHGVWASRLEWFMERTRVRLLICKVDEKTAFERYLRRGAQDGMRKYFHGDPGVGGIAGENMEVPQYIEPKLPVPSIYVDTTDGYAPDVGSIAEMVLSEKKF